MIYILAPVLLILMGLTAYSLFRGLNAFRQGLDANLDPEGVRELQLKQNKMMFSRVKYQALAIVVVMILLAASR